MRTVDEWMAAMEKRDATYCSDSVAAAQEVVWYLLANRRVKQHILEQDVANALVAYARLLHQYGVTP